MKWRYKMSGRQKDKKGYSEMIIIVMVLGIIMRIFYAICTPCTIRSHDLWLLDANSSGHAAYLLNLLQRGQLPESNVRQFYQQPFFYICGALSSKVINTVRGTTGAYDLVDAAKSVSCLASCISLFACKAIFEECSISEKGMLPAISLVAFLPVFYLTGGRVCPDALATMFMILAFLYTLRWLKSPNWKNTIILAVIFGLGMMTKISCGTVAIITAWLFLWKFIKEVRGKRGKTLFLKFIVFGIISFPLGLWYSIRNYIKFGQPLNYVLELSKDLQIYTGDKSIVQRIIGIDIGNWLKTPYADVGSDYNFPVYALKTSLFGEFSYNVYGIYPALLLIFATILAIICGLIIFWQIKEPKKDSYTKIALFSFIIFYGSMIYFYIQYPFGCSMDFRYMAFLVVPVGILLGQYMSQENAFQNWIRIICWGYSISSCLMYCLTPVLL